MCDAERCEWIGVLLLLAGRGKEGGAGQGKRPFLWFERKDLEKTTTHA
jgi:hypothetical protein